MRGVVSVLVLAGVLCATGSAALAAPEAGVPGAKRPDVDLPLEGVVTKPDWIQTPNGNDFATYFPPLAAMLDLAGRTLMQCQVSTTGALENCTVTRETPIGMGFGDAALKISQFFRMKPMTVDGAPVAGAKINIPIFFAAAPRPADAATAPVDGPPPSAKALDLARRIAATSFGPAQMQVYMDRTRQSIVARLFGASVTEQEQAAIDDYVEALGNTGPQRIEALAEHYAHEFTEQQLAEIAAFLESPTGHAWTARGTTGDAALVARLQRAVLDDAQSRFCGKYDCLKQAPPPVAPPPAKN